MEEPQSSIEVTAARSCACLLPLLLLLCSASCSLVFASSLSVCSPCSLSSSLPLLECTTRQDIQQRGSRERREHEEGGRSDWFLSFSLSACLRSLASQSPARIIRLDFKLLLSSSTIPSPPLPHSDLLIESFLACLPVAANNMQQGQEEYKQGRGDERKEQQQTTKPDATLHKQQHPVSYAAQEFSASQLSQASMTCLAASQPSLPAESSPLDSSAVPPEDASPPTPIIHPSLSGVIGRRRPARRPPPELNRTVRSWVPQSSMPASSHARQRLQPGSPLHAQPLLTPPVYPLSPLFAGISPSTFPSLPGAWTQTQTPVNLPVLPPWQLPAPLQMPLQLPLPSIPAAAGRQPVAAAAAAARGAGVAEATAAAGMTPRLATGAELEDFIAKCKAQQQQQTAAVAVQGMPQPMATNAVSPSLQSLPSRPLVPISSQPTALPSFDASWWTPFESRTFLMLVCSLIQFHEKEVDPLRPRFWSVVVDGMKRLIIGFSRSPAECEAHWKGVLQALHLPWPTGGGTKGTKKSKGKGLDEPMIRHINDMDEQ